MRSSRVGPRSDSPRGILVVDLVKNRSDAFTGQASHRIRESPLWFAVGALTVRTQHPAACVAGIEPANLAVAKRAYGRDSNGSGPVIFFDLIHARLA